MNCKNCGTTLLETDNYCSNCGAKVIRNRLTLKNLFEHLSETFFNYDNKLLRTFTALLTKPEEVIGGYISGVRKNYVNPVSLFGLALTINGLQIFLINKFFKNDLLNSASMFVNEEQQNSVANDKIMDLTTGFSLDYTSLLFSLSIPVFSLIAWLLFYSKKYNYTEHTVICLYSMSLYSLGASIFGMLTLLISFEAYFYSGMIIIPLFFLYNIFMYKRLFNLTMGKIILKSFLFILMLIILFIGFIIIMFFLMLATDFLTPEDYAPKK